MNNSLLYGIETEEYENYIVLCAREFVQSLGIKEPPISEYLAAEFLGFDIEQVFLDSYREIFPSMKQIFCESSAHTIRDRNLIIVNGDLPLNKQRADIFHETAHSILPHHFTLDYHYENFNLDKKYHQNIEREASRCGAEIHMPSHWFRPDARSFELGFDAIKALAFRYQASLEATGIQYVRTNFFPCALVVVEPRDHYYSSDNRQLSLFPNKQKIYRKTACYSKCELQVKYAIMSYYFPGKIRSQIGISNNTPIYDAWMTGHARQCDLHASVFGIRDKSVYHAYIHPQNSAGTALIFLSIPSR